MKFIPEHQNTIYFINNKLIISLYLKKGKNHLSVAVQATNIRHPTKELGHLLEIYPRISQKNSTETTYHLQGGKLVSVANMYLPILQMPVLGCCLRHQNTNQFSSKISKSHLRQSLLLQVIVISPTQSCPPFCGGGFIHSLVLTPSPQELLHSENGPQAPSIGGSARFQTMAIY